MMRKFGSWIVGIGLAAGGVGILVLAHQEQPRSNVVPRLGIEDETLGPRREAGPGIRYPEAARAVEPEEVATALPANVNIMAKGDVVMQSSIDGVAVKTCNPGKQTAQNEFSIAANPADANNLVVGANDYRLYESSENRYDGAGGFFRTTNGGKKWTLGYLPGLVRGNSSKPGPYESAGDPVVAAGPNNVFWYANIAFNRGDNASAIAVSRSADKGATWSTAYVVQTPAVDGENIFNDKEWVAADPTNDQVAYVTWTQFAGWSSLIVCSKTMDGGTTWSQPARVTNRASNQGSVGCVDSQGRLHVIWETYGAYSALAYARRDATGAFGTTRILARISDLPNPLPWGEFRMNSFPCFALDGNTLHVVWAGWNGSDGDIVYMRSTNGGGTWSKPVTIAGGVSDQFYPWIAARNGLVAVMLLDHDGEGGSGYHAALVKSKDSGATWSARVRVSTAGSDPSSGNLFGYPNCQPSFIGDYNGIAIDAAGKAHVVWPDIRRGNSPGDPGSTADQDPYTATIALN